MKKTVIRVLAFLVLLLTVPAMLLCAAAGLPSLYGETYYGELAPLVERLDGAEGKKLVLIGGSNIAFGVDAGLLEELLAEKGYDYTVCPFGLYAALGSGTMLSLSQAALDEGDLVVLAFEPTDETLSSYFGASVFLKCAEDAPELLGRLDARRRAAVLGNTVPFLQERLSVVHSGPYPEAEGVYSRSAFGPEGTMEYDRPGNIMALGFDTEKPVDLTDLRIDDEFREEVNDYCRRAERKGAQVLLSFCPVNRSALADDSEEALYSWFSLCGEAFDCPIISDPGRYVLDSAWFYDSNVHLNSAGATLRTVLLAEDILAQLGCYEPVDYPIPAAPASAYIPPESSGAAADFLYEPVADGAGWAIVGLSEQGREKTELTMPETVDGKPVVSFAAGAFDSADKLEELRLPESVETIPDRAFVGCPALKRLVLLHENRPCGVTPRSFDGAAELRVYVPAEAWPMYRDGFGCETNPWTEFVSRIYVYG